MVMVIVRQGESYGAVMTAPHTTRNYWSTAGFLPEEELVKALLQAGTHQTDIGDLLNELEVDPQKFCAVMP